MSPKNKEEEDDEEEEEKDEEDGVPYTILNNPT